MCNSWYSLMVNVYVMIWTLVSFLWNTIEDILKNAGIQTASVSIDFHWMVKNINGKVNGKRSCLVNQDFYKTFEEKSVIQVCLSICPSICISLSIYLSIFHLFINLSFSLSIYLSIHSSSIYPSIHLYLFSKLSIKIFLSHHSKFVLTNFAFLVKIDPWISLNFNLLYN